MTGILSYPRTPSRVLGDDNVDLVRSIYVSLKDQYKTFSDGSKIEYIDRSNKRVFNSKRLRDHHAIIPLKALPTDADDESSLIYTLILDSFFTAFKDPYIYNSIQVLANVGEFGFKGFGKEILALGWRKNKAGEEEEDKENQVVPALEAGDLCAIVKADCVDKFTEPKRHFTQASLLQLMDNPKNTEGESLVGIGTPATRGSIIKLLFDRDYIYLDKKDIGITEKGIFLIKNLQKNELLAEFVSLEQTSLWEEMLEKDPRLFLEEIKAFVKKTIKTSNFSTYTLDSLGACPVCTKPIKEGKKNYYCSGYKEGCSFSVWKEICAARIPASDLELLLKGQTTKIKKMKNKEGKVFQAKLRLEEGKVKFVFENARGGR